MPKAKSKPTVKLTIELGPVSPAQKAAWQKLWQKLISEVNANDR